MCRLLGYIGPTVDFSSLLVDPPWSLRQQTFAPRHQSIGRINADGWGVGWYDPSVGPLPARYRTATPMWADHAFDDIRRHLRSGHVVAAARNASPGLPVEESGNSPFVGDRYLFTHNGFVRDWHEGVGLALRREVSERREPGIGGRSDSEVVFALVLDHLDAGASMADALRAVITHLHTLAGGYFNLLVSDGSTIVATRDGNSLCVVERGDARIVASEPFDDEPDWVEVDERSLVTVSSSAISIEPL